MDDETEAVLRRALAGRSRPELAPDFSSAVLRRVAVRAASHDGRVERSLLGAYWVVASLASLVLLSRLRWPASVLSALGPLALALVPAGYAAFLWPGRLNAWVALFFRPFLAEPSTGRD